MNAFIRISFIACMIVFIGTIYLCVSVARDLNLNERNSGNTPVETYWNSTP